MFVIKWCKFTVAKSNPATTETRPDVKTVNLELCDVNLELCDLILLI